MRKEVSNIKYNKKIGIELKQLSKKFGEQYILEEVNYQFEYGKIYGIIGENGCGKSVIFKLISGLLFPSSGKIYVDRKELRKGDFPKNMGVLIESPGFLPQYTGMDNLKLLASVRNICTKKELEESMKFVGLDPNNKTKVKHYSLGMLQRLGIAQAIMEKQEIILLDEPFNSMDEKGVEEIRKKLKEVLKDRGALVIITSHNKKDIEFLCDEVIVLQNRTLEKISKLG